MTRWLRRSGAELLGDLFWSTLAAFGLAGLLSALVALSALARGAVAYPEYGTSLGSIIGVYFAAAAIGGPVAGLLLPLGKWRLGAAALGGVAGVIFYGTIAVGMDGGISADGVQFALAVGVPVGAIVGAVLWSPPDSASDRSAPSV